MSGKEEEMNEEEDLYDLRIKMSGCAKYHYALQVLTSWMILFD